MIDPAEHLPLALFLARKYGRTAGDPEAVLEVAVLALLGAARRFDPARGPWGAFASKSIAKAVQGEFTRQKSGPREVPLTFTGLDGEEHERRDLPHELPLDGQRLMAEAVQATVARLPEREAAVVRLRFGLDDGKPRTLEAIGQALGVTRERVRQIERRAMRSLQKALTTRRAVLPRRQKVNR